MSQRAERGPAKSLGQELIMKETPTVYPKILISMVSEELLRDPNRPYQSPGLWLMVSDHYLRVPVSVHTNALMLANMSAGLLAV
jgi:hypothetical protein